MNFFSNIFTPKKGPPTNTLNDYTYQFDVNQLNFLSGKKGIGLESYE